MAALDSLLSRLPPGFTRWLLLLGAVIHVAMAYREQWPIVLSLPDARDFASYYYAAQLAADGRDPYVLQAIDLLAIKEGTRLAVNPFIYPPPYLLTMLWTLPLTLEQAYRAWFWLDCLFAIGAALVLWRWRPGPVSEVTLAALLVFFTPAQNNHIMGQANLPVLMLIGGGLLMAHRGRFALGGVLMGVACMMKMSPALLVAWWLVSGRWRPVLWACATALALTALSWPLVGWEGQRHFYTDVLPGFSRGDYHGLIVPILLFGNHSIANLWAQAFPSRGELSEVARLGATLCNLALVTAALATLRRAAATRGAVLAAAGAMVVVMVVVPVYAYEHHLTYMIITILAVVLGLADGRLRRRWLWLLLPTLVVLCWPNGNFRWLHRQVPPPLDWMLQEIKFFSALAWGIASWAVARRVVAHREGGGVSTA